MTDVLHSEVVIKFLVVLYFLDRLLKGYLGIPLAPILDMFLITVLFTVISRGIPKSDMNRLALVFIAGMLLLGRLSHGFTLDSLTLVLTSRMPLMVFITVFLSIFYLRRLPDIEIIGRFIENVMAFLIISIILDGVYVNYIGSVYDLISLFEQAGYRFISNSTFFNFNAQGPIVPGPQHASIISCAGIILFFQSRNIAFKRALLFLLSIFSLSLSVTNTALASLLIALIAGYFVTFQFKYKSIVMGIGLLMLFLFVAYLFNDWIAYRYGILENADDTVILAFIENNIEKYLSPLKNLQQMPFYVLLVGVGHSSITSVADSLVKIHSLVAHGADFGYLYMLFEHGLINVVMLASLYIGFILYVKRNLKYVLEKKKRIYIVKLVIVVSLFVVSGVHYMTITKGGLLQIVILMASIAIISIHKSRRRLNQTINVNNNL